ncbi:hypothetical protein ACO2Q3_15100 [Caulobacter sp. KR2-114]|uniref:hypothetical protein n=1 Tax=Caulobacter sp. KR2-114 TaxID=3400912 RepID=UPI003C035A24
MILKTFVTVLALAWTISAAAQPAGDSAASPAKPQGKPSGRAVYRVCKPDMNAYCPHMGLGSARQKQCMRDNFDKLAPDCQAILKRFDPQAAK